MSDPNMVTISIEEYTGLKEAEEWLEALESAGVDNWDGISYARQLLREFRDEDEDE